MKISTGGGIERMNGSMIEKEKRSVINIRREKDTVKRTGTKRG